MSIIFKLFWIYYIFGIDNLNLNRERVDFGFDVLYRI